MTTTSINLNLIERFKSKSFFHKFFLHRVSDEISSKIRDLREKRELTQKEFASQADMKQSAVSRLEQADYGGWNFKTLARIAEVLDARLVVDFVPREDVIKDFEGAKKRNNPNEQMSVLEALREARTLERSRNGYIRNEVPGDMSFQHVPTNRIGLLSGYTHGSSTPIQLHRRSGILGTDDAEHSHSARGQV